ncbi:polysaccharide biosynthesis tyrosine autokinase [Microbacterium ulmi]|uniref:Polysaccharide biosynthesis tyrosine autokinase n=1 Tax=Microbacterium ulmi TaxID=179095 RepID=A0A7Y2LZ74_9MICO|nr:capsular exopolysaccharide synthesis family protein [Microbacterium ulmi]NNH03257.1 polysaccharide biosynthesis tyrosine autokinase [Microbacterium ulmi]
MTFREILNVLWQRRWAILLVVVLAVLAAGLYVVRQTPVYQASTTLKLNAAAASGMMEQYFGSIPVDFDTESIGSPEVLKAAAEIVGETPATALYGTTTWRVVEGARTDRIIITVTGPSPGVANDRANAVADAYITYINNQVAAGLVALQGQQADKAAQAADLQRQVTANPDDSIASSSLARALSSLGTLSTQVEAITLAGSPLTVQTPADPGSRVGNPPALVLAVAFAVGLMAGIGMALIWVQFDTRVRDEREFESLVDVPLIAQLPWDPKLTKRDDRLPVLARARTPLNEGIRSMRTSLQVLARTSGSIFVITSVEPNDGKTFVSANLAATWARSGKRIVLIGGDLRRPELPTYFGGAAEGPGLAELLQKARDSHEPISGEDVEQLLSDTDIAGLKILPAGSEPPDPADLLASDSLSLVLDLVRARADVIIVDSPPSYALTDAALLAKHATGAVVLASLGRTRRDRFVDTVDDLVANDVAVVGVVANRSRKRVPKSYDRYYSSTRDMPHERRSSGRVRLDLRPSAGKPAVPKDLDDFETADDEVILDEPIATDEHTTEEHADSPMSAAKGNARSGG